MPKTGAQSEGIRTFLTSPLPKIASKPFAAIADPAAPPIRG
jgi:hypothetical protein